MTPILELGSDRVPRVRRPFQPGFMDGFGLANPLSVVTSKLQPRAVPLSIQYSHVKNRFAACQTLLNGFPPNIHCLLSPAREQAEDSHSLLNFSYHILYRLVHLPIEPLAMTSSSKAPSDLSQACSQGFPMIETKENVKIEGPQQDWLFLAGCFAFEALVWGFVVSILPAEYLEPER
jgi:hypothetical protein